MGQVGLNRANLRDALKPYSEKLNFKVKDIIAGEMTYKAQLIIENDYAMIPFTNVLLISIQDKMVIISINKFDILDLLHVSTLLPKTK